MTKLDPLITFADACDRLDCSTSDLAYVIAIGRLTPIYIATRTPRLRLSELTKLQKDLPR